MGDGHRNKRVHDRDEWNGVLERTVIVGTFGFVLGVPVRAIRVKGAKRFRDCHRTRAVSSCLRNQYDRTEFIVTRWARLRFAGCEIFRRSVGALRT